MAAVTHTFQKGREHARPEGQRSLVIKMAVTSLALVILLLYLMPLGYSFVTSLKSKGQVADPNAPLLPAIAGTYTYDGEDYDVYQVPTAEGVKRWALIDKGKAPLSTQPTPRPVRSSGKVAGVPSSPPTNSPCSGATTRRLSSLSAFCGCSG